MITTYQHNEFRYFYDPAIKSWTIYKLDEQGNQIGTADYCANKDQLKRYYPSFKFRKITG